MGDDPLIGYCTASVRFERLLGRGAMGAVYCGVQLSLQRPVAIKVIASHLTEDPAYLARFEREAHTLGRLVHPHVIACHDFGPSDGPDGKPIYLMVMEFVDGWSLGWLAKNKRISVRSVLELHRQAADGLSAAHALGIIHRDIKPDNILVTRDGQAKLADFGLARELSQESDLTAAGSILGSPGFMSPETCRGLEPTSASDVYSLGCSMVQVLSGAPTFSNTSALAVMQMHISQPIPKLGARRPELASLQDIVESCLAKEPTARHSAKDLSHELSQRIPTFSRALLAGKQIQGGGNVPVAGGSSRLPMASVHVMATTAGAAAGNASISTSIPARRVASPRRGARVLVVAACVLVPAVLAMVLASHGGAATHGLADPHEHADPPTTQPASTQPLAQAPASQPPPVPIATTQNQHAIDPDAADRERLARIALMIDHHDLDQAESALADLVVTGELKQGKKSLLERLDAARIAQGAAISRELDAAKAQIASDPSAAAARLRALAIPDHFADLDDARQQLITQAERTAPASVTRPAPARPAQASRLSGRGDGRQVRIGAAELPGPLPFGETTFLASLEHVSKQTGDVAYMGIHLPAGGNQDGFLALVHAQGAITILAKENIDGTKEGGAPFAIKLAGKEWELIRVPLTLQTSGARVVYLVTPFQNGPFYFAGAALGGGGMPSWSNLKMVPGTLTSGSAENIPLAVLRAKHRDFPGAALVRFALPDSRKGASHELLSRVLQGFGMDLAHDWPGWADGRLAFFPDRNERYAVLDQLSDARQAAGIAIALHWLSTASGPTFRPSDIAPALLAALHDDKDAVLPVLVFAPEATTLEAHTPWATFQRQLRELVPGLPMIDLNLVLLEDRRLGGTLVAGSAQARAACDQAFQGGINELVARLRAN